MTIIGLNDTPSAAMDDAAATIAHESKLLESPRSCATQETVPDDDSVMSAESIPSQKHDAETPFRLTSFLSSLWAKVSHVFEIADNEYFEYVLNQEVIFRHRQQCIALHKELQEHWWQKQLQRAEKWERQYEEWKRQHEEYEEWKRERDEREQQEEERRRQIDVLRNLFDEESSIEDSDDENDHVQYHGRHLNGHDYAESELGARSYDEYRIVLGVHSYSSIRRTYRRPDYDSDDEIAREYDKENVENRI